MSGAVDHVCQPAGTSITVTEEVMYGPKTSPSLASPAAAAWSSWSPRVARPLPCRRAPRATRAISSIMIMMTLTSTPHWWLCGPHEPGNQPSSGLSFERRSTRKHCRQRADAARDRARAPGTRSLMTLSQPREFCPHRHTPGWPGSLPTARAPQPSGCGHTRITRARLQKVVATSRHASLDAYRASSALAPGAPGAQMCPTPV